MRILVLSPYSEGIIGAVRAANDMVFVTNEEIDVAMLRRLSVDWIVSYGYRHLVREPVLSEWRNRVINLHISLLPYNRGADPNFWSWFDGTPKGVTIHQIDEGMDSGPILVQREVAFAGDETLFSSYERLRVELEQLFRASWPEIRTGAMQAVPQTSAGTLHRRADKIEFFAGLAQGYGTPVRQIEERGEAHRQIVRSRLADSERR